MHSLHSPTCVAIGAALVLPWYCPGTASPQPHALPLHCTTGMGRRHPCRWTGACCTRAIRRCTCAAAAAAASSGPIPALLGLAAHSRPEGHMLWVLWGCLAQVVLHVPHCRCMHCPAASSTSTTPLHACTGRISRYTACKLRVLVVLGRREFRVQRGWLVRGTPITAGYCLIIIAFQRVGMNDALPHKPHIIIIATRVRVCRVHHLAMGLEPCWTYPYTYIYLYVHAYQVHTYQVCT